MYESRFDDHARDTKRETIELQRFVQRVPRAKAEHLTPTELLCIAFFRRVFEQPGLFALPADVFDFATLASSALESNGPRGGIKPHDVLQGVSLAVSSWGAASVAAGSLFERFGRMSFFEVICTNPQQLVQKGAGHRSIPRGLVRVRQVRATVCAPQESIMVCSAEGRYCNIDCGSWCQTPIFESVVSSMWVCRNPKPLEEFRDASMAGADADMLERVSSIPIRDDNLTVSGLFMLEDVPQPEGLDTALVATGETTTFGAEGRAHALRSLLTHGAFSDSPPTAWCRHESDTSVFVTLCVRGMAKARAIADGANVYAIVAAAVQLRALQRYDNANVAVVPETSELRSVSKIEIAAELLARGWRVALSSECEIAKDDPRVLTPRFMHASKAFWLVLIHLDDIFTKPQGLATILLCQHELY